MEVHAFNPSTQEAEAGESLWVWGQPGLPELVPGQAPKLQRNPVSIHQKNALLRLNKIFYIDFKKRVGPSLGEGMSLTRDRLMVPLHMLTAEICNQTNKFVNGLLFFKSPSRHNSVKQDQVYLLPKAIYRLNTMAIKIPAKFFKDFKRTALEFIWKTQIWG